MLISAWKAFPFYSLVILAALQGVPSERYEAARVDGANALQLFRHIIIPGIAPTLLLLVVLAAIFSFKQFTIIYLLTGGGPAGCDRDAGGAHLQHRVSLLRLFVQRHPGRGRLSDGHVDRAACSWPPRSRTKPSWATDGLASGTCVATPATLQSGSVRLAAWSSTLLVVLVCAIVMFPVYWMMLSAIQPARLSMRYPPPFCPAGRST